MFVYFSLTIFARKSILNVDPKTLAIAMAVTSPTVNCIPGLERAINLLTITIMTIAIVIGYKTTSTGTEYLIIALNPRFAIAKPIKVKTVA